MLPCKAFAQFEDTLVYGPAHPFIKDVMLRSGFIYPIWGGAQSFVKTTYKHSILKGQQLIKSGNDIFVYIDWTGMVYKMVGKKDQTFIYKRIDSTININYNGSGKIYLHQKEIHLMGGYGFWKTNGTDKKFNFKDWQWDVVPLTEEIIPQLYPTIMLWHDPQTQTVWMPYQRILNGGIQNASYQEGKIDPQTYKLNLQTKEWKSLGNTDPEWVSLCKNAALEVDTDKGMLFLHGGYLYHFDFPNNAVYRSKDFSLYQSYARINHESHRYVYHNKLFYFDPTKKKYDSLWLAPETFELLNKPIYTAQFSTQKLVLWVSGIILIAGMFFLLSRKKRTNLIEHSPIANKPTAKRDLSFSDTENALISLLKKKSLSNESTRIDEINYVLGVKDKNIGLQKKVRSDMINSINEKYKLSTGKENSLIQSIRLDADKRQLAYYIDPADAGI
jgi:hypothetical protein